MPKTGWQVLERKEIIPGCGRTGNFGACCKRRQEGAAMRNVYRLLVVSLVCCAAYPPAFATEPCLPSPCTGTDGKVDTAKCARLAAWVATGTISRVIHHEQGDPLFKDFAEFSFTVKASEKGSIKVGREVRFQVGWCQNWLALPKNTSGTFRFFGLPLPTDVTLPNQYLYFESAPAHRK
jgi:hypothetical protein